MTTHFPSWFLRFRPYAAESLLWRVKGAETHAKGLWIAIDPGSTYTTIVKFCTSLHSLLSLRSHQLVLAYFVDDGIVPRKGKGGGLVDQLKNHGVAVTKYEATQGSNMDKGEGNLKKIMWCYFGVGAPTFKTPLDQMDARVVVEQANIDLIRDGDTVVVPPPVPPPVPRFRRRNVPSEVIVKILDDNGNRYVATDDDERELNEYALGHLLRAKRKNVGGVTTLTVDKRYLGGGPDDTFFTQSVVSRGGFSPRTLRRRRNAVDAHLRHGKSKSEVMDIVDSLAKRNEALQEFLAIQATKNPGVLFSDAESKHLLNLVGTQQAYRELASKMRKKFGNTGLAAGGEITLESK